MASSDITWGIIFAFGIWTLWTHRNGILFWNDRIQQNLKHEISTKANEFSYFRINGKLIATRRIIRVSSLKPPLNWFKLNSNGSSLGNPGRASDGGLIRNNKGEWIRGYARAIGHTTSVAAELWALRGDIRLCISLKLPTVILELDAKLIVELMQKEDCNQNSIDALVRDCKSGLKEIPLVQIQHCYHKANKCGNMLARRGSLLSQDFVVFLDPPVDVAFLLRLDSAGMVYKRSVIAV